MKILIFYRDYSLPCVIRDYRRSQRRVLQNVVFKDNIFSLSTKFSLVLQFKQEKKCIRMYFLPEMEELQISVIGIPSSCFISLGK